MIAPGYLIAAGGLVLIAGSFSADQRALRGSLALAALIGLIGAVMYGRWIVAGIALLLLVINLVTLTVLFLNRRAARLTEEEKVMAQRTLPGMPRASIRQLLDQGLWIDGKIGEALIREGQPVSHLFYMSEGEAAVISGGKQVATCQPGHFLGEMTVLSGQPATASVTLSTPARFWCVAADSLRAFLAANPSFRPALEAAFSGTLRDKLRLANERLTG